DPDVVALIDGEAIGAVDAVGQYRGRACLAARHGKHDDGIVASVSNEKSSALVVEGDSVGAEGRLTRRGEERVARPLRRESAVRTRLPDDALEGIRNVDVPEAIERQRIDPRCRSDIAEEARCSGLRIDVQHLSGPEVENQKLMGHRMERESEQ